MSFISYLFLKRIVSCLHTFHASLVSNFLLFSNMAGSYSSTCTELLCTENNTQRTEKSLTIQTFLVFVMGYLQICILTTKYSLYTAELFSKYNDTLST